MIWVIAQKEIRDNLLSLRFLLLFLLAIIFIPSSLYTNYRAYLTRVADQQQVDKNNREYLRKLQPTQIFTTANFTIDIYWPPSPASVFAVGFEDIHPRHLIIGKNSVEYGAPLEDRSSIGLFGSIDYLFVVEFVFSLFGILMSFDAITREKENGTLRSILANSVSRPVLATGKLLGGYVTLALPLVVSFLAGILVLQLSGMSVFEREFLVRAAWILVSSLLYLAVFFLLGLLVSSTVSSTYAALVLSLAVWLGAVLVLPRAGSLGAQLWRPVKSAQVAWLEKLSAANAIEMEKGKALQEAGVFKNLGAKASDEEQQRLRKQRNELAAPFDERAAEAIRRIEGDYRQRKAEQLSLGLALARLSPAGAFVNFATEMSDTGIQAADRFMNDAERYREVLRQELFSKFYRDVFPGGVSMGMTGSISPARLSEFRMARVRAVDNLGGVDLAILLSWFLACALLTYAALGRYDVR